MMSDVDVVITWVDGSDPKHIQKRRMALLHENIDSKSIPAGRDQTRFADGGELRYCIYSIRKFAPWVRRIYLVSDGQKPSYFTDNEMEDLNMKIVDHAEIFDGYEWALPTFNSISIETMIYRIQGLSDHFLYLNDDFIIVKDVSREDFFIDDGVVLRGVWSKIQRFGRARLLVSHMLNHLFKKLFGINRSMSLLQQMRAAELAGMRDDYYRSPHVPHPIRKKTLSMFFDEHPDVINNNIKHKFRNSDQFVSIFLANHIEIQNKNAKLVSQNDAVMICFNRDRARVVEERLASIKNGEKKFFCLQSFEQASEAQRRNVNQLLDRIIFDKLDRDRIFQGETL